MSTSVRFSKMHGLGNDFMVLDLVSQRAELAPERIRSLADRRTGIGFDQLLVLEPPTNPEADFRYRIWNADGTEVEQCGNGVRCAARFALLAGLTQKAVLVLQSRGGLLTTTVATDGSVSVQLPAPQVQAAIELEVPGHPELVTVLPVSVGNPHAVVFVPDVNDAPVALLGPAIGGHALFPEGVNVGFCEIVDQGFARLRVYERGAGETRACGTGACAAAVAGQATGRLGGQVKVSLPGGKLRLHWPGPGQGIRMDGPAAHVFEGQISL